MMRAGLHQAPRRRHLQLHADGPARDPQGRGHRARGDEPRRRGRTADAGRAAGRAVAGVRALPGLWARAAAREGPARPRLRDPADQRRGHHRHRAPGTAQLQAAAEELLSHPDQVPRRAPAALRPDARARVHDEGRLLLRPRPGRGATQLRADVRGLLRASSTASACSTAPWPPTPAPSAATRRTSSRSSPTPARTRSSTAPTATTPPTSSWPRRCPASPRAARRRSRW